jgi:hypothetical protein
MSHSHTFAWRPRLFRAFVTNQYYTNRDEYHAVGQHQPYTFDEYVQENLTQLKRDYKQHRQSMARLLKR